MSYHENIQLAGTVTVGSKGQVVIPVEVRDSMKIKPGDKLVVLYLEEKKSVAFITERHARAHIVKMGEEFTSFKAKES